MNIHVVHALISETCLQPTRPWSEQNGRGFRVVAQEKVSLL